ncbi:MAG: hypothetical protein EXS31_09530 [Pedosphaera sp.]|nr:hypothetical protein [Pedosphaera sp.]
MNATITASELLGEFVEPLGRALTVDSARALLEIRTSGTAQRHISELAERCNRGTLSPGEKAEYQLLVEVGDVIALLQARARLYLRDHAA